MIFGNPVPGTLRPPQWTRPPGNTDFKVTQVFGCTGFPSEPAYGSCAHYHRGIDLGNGRGGDPVVAVESGTVTLAGADPNSGNALRVWIEHPGGWFSGYYHLHDFDVRAGEKVTKGELLGHVGMTGWATANHLHFEVHATSDRLSFFDPWPHFIQNVTVHAKGPGINIRSGPGAGSTPGPLYATTGADGHIRTPGGLDLGLTADPRKWGGQVPGANVSQGGVTSDRWEKMSLGGTYRYIWTPLAQRSVS